VPRTGKGTFTGKVGLLTNIGDPKALPQVQELAAAAKTLGINIVSQDANRPEDLEGALQALEKEDVYVVIVLQTSIGRLRRCRTSGQLSGGELTRVA
jgi:ABC-type uncharacterized transport system substrate-binding protein